MRISGIFIYILAALFLLFEMALQVSPSIMTRPLMHDFGIDAMVLGIICSFYFYSYTLMQIPVGILFDRFSTRTLITSAVFICSVGALFFGTTQDLYYAALGRFLMGIGSAFAFVGVLVVAARWFPGRYFALLVGVAQLLAAVGALLGELPLAALLNSFSWREVMMILGTIGVGLTLLSFTVVRDHPSKEQHIPHRHHLFRELRVILKFGQTWWVALYAFCSWGPVAVFAALWGLPYLRVRYEIPVTEAALAMAMVWIGIGITSPILGYLSDKLGRRCILLSFCSLVGLISSSALLLLPIPLPLAFLLLFGIGVGGSGQILTFALTKDNNRSTTIGTAVGLNNMAVVAGGALFQPLVGFILQLLWVGGRAGNGIPLYTTATYNIALLVVPLCFFVGLLVSLFCIKETHCRPRFDAYSDSLA
ncbi:MAG: putative sulfoacetate transporter SauU [Chlamydiae bacterium]|nr:putative sulfoacetate transporter SauU [Chlamydiota bacterium]